jgi:hypothetical protein
MYSMTCPKCGRVWMTTNPKRKRGETCREDNEGCGAPLPAPVAEKEATE